MSEHFKTRELVNPDSSVKNNTVNIEHKDEMMDVTEDIGQMDLDSASSKKTHKKKKKTKGQNKTEI